MNVNNADGVRHVTRAEWDALREQCRQVLTASAQAGAAAQEAQAEAVEQRLRFEGGGPVHD